MQSQIRLIFVVHFKDTVTLNQFQVSEEVSLCRVSSSLYYHPRRYLLYGQSFTRLVLLGKSASVVLAMADSEA
jgi:hypothetical protein